MKRLILLIVLLPLFIVLNAQVAVGFRAGFQANKFKDNIYDKGVYTYSIGYLGGGMVSLGYNRTLSLQIELNLSEKRSDYEDIAHDDKYTFILDYVEIPALIKINLGRNDFKLFTFLGPYGSFPVREKYDYGGSDDPSFSPLFEGDFGYFDLGLKFGGGISYKVGNGTLFGELRFNYGFAQALMDNYLDSNGIEATVGILLQLPRKK